MGGHDCLSTLANHFFLRCTSCHISPGKFIAAMPNCSEVNSTNTSASLRCYVSVNIPIPKSWRKRKVYAKRHASKSRGVPRSRSARAPRCRDASWQGRSPDRTRALPASTRTFQQGFRVRKGSPSKIKRVRRKERIKLATGVQSPTQRKHFQRRSMQKAIQHIISQITLAKMKFKCIFRTSGQEQEWL